MQTYILFSGGQVLNDIFVLVLAGIQLIFLYVRMGLCFEFVLKAVLKHRDALVTAEQF